MSNSTASAEVTSAGPAPDGRRTWAAHAAAVWAFVFAAASFYWASGGRVGVATVGDIVTGMMGRGGWFIAVVWLTGGLKAAGGMLALALVRPWGGKLPRRLLLAATAAAGCVLTGYALLQFGARAVLAVGLLPTPASMYSAQAWWHLFLWDPWFLAGGVLFLLATWQAHRGTAAQ